MSSIPLPAKSEGTWALLPSNSGPEPIGTGRIILTISGESNLVSLGNVFSISGEQGGVEPDGSGVITDISDVNFIGLRRGIYSMSTSAPIGKFGNSA